MHGERVKVMNELLQKLFTYTTQVTYKGVTFYLRLPNEQVIADARDRALLASNALRRELRNPDSEAYLMYLSPAEDYTQNELQAYVLLQQLLEAMRAYQQRNPKPALPKLSDYPTLEEQEAYAVAQQQRDQEYQAAMETYFEQWREERLRELEQLSREQLLQLYKKHRIDALCQEKFTDVFERYVMAAAVFLDPDFTQPAFTFETYANVPKHIRSMLEQALTSITPTDDELKK